MEICSECKKKVKIVKWVYGKSEKHSKRLCKDCYARYKELMRYYFGGSL